MQVKTREAFQWATIDAAKMLGIDDKVGSITPGKKADLVMFKTNKINFMPMHDPKSSILFHSNSNDIDTVMVNGKILKQHGQLLQDDLKKDLQLLSDSGNRIIKDFQK